MLSLSSVAQQFIPLSRGAVEGVVQLGSQIRMCSHPPVLSFIVACAQPLSLTPQLKE